MELTFPLILDGATGTELQKRGFTGGGCAEAWYKRISFTERTSQIMDSDCGHSGISGIDRNLDLDCKWWDKIKQAGRLSEPPQIV